MKRFPLALAALITIGFAFAPKQAPANFSATAPSPARMAPNTDAGEARIVCRRGRPGHYCGRTRLGYYWAYRRDARPDHRCRIARAWRNGRPRIVRRCRR